MLYALSVVQAATNHESHFHHRFVGAGLGIRFIRLRDIQHRGQKMEVWRSAVQEWTPMPTLRRELPTVPTHGLQIRHWEISEEVPLRVSGRRKKISIEEISIKKITGYKSTTRVMTSTWHHPEWNYSRKQVHGIYGDKHWEERHELQAKLTRNNTPFQAPMVLYSEFVSSFNWRIFKRKRLELGQECCSIIRSINKGSDNKKILIHLNVLCSDATVDTAKLFITRSKKKRKGWQKVIMR